jgi:hypothetical protein
MKHSFWKSFWSFDHYRRSSIYVFLLCPKVKEIRSIWRSKREESLTLWYWSITSRSVLFSLVSHVTCTKQHNIIFSMDNFEKNEICCSNEILEKQKKRPRGKYELETSNFLHYTNCKTEICGEWEGGQRSTNHTMYLKSAPTSLVRATSQERTKPQCFWLLHISTYSTLVVLLLHLFLSILLLLVVLTGVCCWAPARWPLEKARGCTWTVSTPK